MGKDMSTEFGQINISDDVIATISGIAATECYGLVGMASRNLQDGSLNWLGWTTCREAWRCTWTGMRCTSRCIIVEYGTKITEVAHNVMGKVKYVIESMTGLTVTGVDVVVPGVRVASRSERQGETTSSLGSRSGIGLLQCRMVRCRVPVPF